MSEEIWVQHPEFNAYYISNKGRVYSTYKSGKILKLKSDKDGYLEAALTKDKKVYYRRVHRLVAECFLPNPDNLPVINHKDQDKTNNQPDNLEWCDTYYNTTYSLDIDLEKVKKVPELYLLGMNYNEIIEHLGNCFSKTTISEILSGRKHSRITGVNTDLRDEKQLRREIGFRSDDEVLGILKDYYINGLSQTEITKKYKASPASISRIINGKRYKNLYDYFMEEYG